MNKMNRMALCAKALVAFGMMGVSGCFSNGAVKFDSKCGAYEKASVSKAYYIERIELKGVTSVSKMKLHFHMQEFLSGIRRADAAGGDGGGGVFGPVVLGVAAAKVFAH